LLLSVVSGPFYEWFARGGDPSALTYMGIGALVAALTVSLLESRGFYRRSLVLDRNATKQILNIWLIVFSLLAISAFLLGIGHDYSRGALSIYFFLGLTGLVVVRWSARRIL